MIGLCVGRYPRWQILAANVDECEGYHRRFHGMTSGQLGWDTSKYVTPAQKGIIAFKVLISPYHGVYSPSYEFQGWRRNLCVDVPTQKHQKHGGPYMPGYAYRDCAEGKTSPLL